MSAAGLKAWWQRFLGSFSGALMALSPVLPGFGAVSVTILYVYRTPGGGTAPTSGVDSAWLSGTSAYVIGTGAAALCWVGLALLFRTRLSSVETANASVYRELREQYDFTMSRLASNPVGGDPPNPTATAARDEAVAQLALCQRELDPGPTTPTTPGMDWVLATGYVTLWRRIHRAQEALFLIEPKADVVGRAMFDRARLDHSAIAGSDDLLAQLNRAILTLEPAAAHLANLPVEASTDLGAPPAGAPPPPDPAAAECQARMVLRNTARIINQFRDDRREGLIRARNNLYRTVFITAATAYLLYGLALIREVDELAIVAMVTFYLLGGILGLFRQLGQASSVETVREGDYGLSTARLFHTPLLSGLAAVGGVVLVAELGAIIPATEGPPDIHSLTEIFNLSKNPFGLVAAAVFGLTPNLLNQRLERQAEQFKDDLKSTEASGAVGTATSAD